MGTLVCTVDTSKQVKVPLLEAVRVLAGYEVAAGQRIACQRDIPDNINFMTQNIYHVTRDSTEPYRKQAFFSETVT